MAGIYEQLLYTTLRIECLNDQGQVYSIGTGFLLQRPVGENKVKLYLVSNRHVLYGAEAIAISFTGAKMEKLILET